MREMKHLNCFSSDHPRIDQFTNLVFCIFIFMTIASLYFLYMNAVGLFILCEGFIVRHQLSQSVDGVVPFIQVFQISHYRSPSSYFYPHTKFFSQFYIGFHRKRLHPPLLIVLFFFPYLL